MSLFNNSSLFYIRKLVVEVETTLSRNSLILDAGCGNTPYKDVFLQHRYETADAKTVAKEYSDITYHCDLNYIPVKEKHYDFILCTQTLEHVRHPQQVLKELHRVLKDNGKLLVTAPFYYEEHEIPHDYFRFTQFGIRNLLTDAGFRVEQSGWVEGYFGTLAYQMKLASQCLPRHPRLYGKGIVPFCTALFITSILRPFAKVMGVILCRLDYRFKVTSTGHPKNYWAIASPF